MGLVGLVLSGGGARAAYGAGVLRYIGRELFPLLPERVRFDIITGTSAGAINGAFLAAGADDLASTTEALYALWDEVRIGSVYRFGARQLWRVPRSILSDRSGHPVGEVALADIEPLRSLLRTRIDWGRLRRVLESGRLAALSVTATEVATSRSVAFLEGPAPDHPVLESRNPFFRPRLARLGPEHVLASAAIPLLFPPVKVGGRHYLDGGLGMNTPLRPALRLGARKVLVLSLRFGRPIADADAVAERQEGAAPTWAQVVGKTMSAVLLDRVNHDVERLERVNRMLEWGVERYGDGFGAEYGDFVTGVRGIPYRSVRALLIAPSQDIGALASEVTRDRRFGEGADEVTIRALRFLAGANASGENDAMSYLLFDPVFVRHLLALGESDARARRDELLEFFAS